MQARLKFFPFLVLILLSVLPVSAQGVIGGAATLGGAAAVGGGATVAGNTYTFVQATTTAGCTSPCGVTVSSTGTGHLLYVTHGDGNGAANFITAVSGGCSGSWVIPAASQKADGSAGSVSSAYCLSSSSGATTITVTTAGTGHVRIFEYSATSAPAFDVCNAGDNSGAATTQPGVALTLATSSELIFQGTEAGGANINSINMSYIRIDGVGGGQASAVLENTSNGSAPTWTQSASAASVVNGCAFK